jgi:hypothetical protein
VVVVAAEWAAWAEWATWGCSPRLPADSHRRAIGKPVALLLFRGMLVFQFTSR